MKGKFNGLIVCKKCGGYYELQPGESPDDFSGCHCGGDLKYVESSDNEKSNRNEFWRSWISGILMGFVAFFGFKLIVASLVGGAITAYGLGGSYKDGAKNGFITGAVIMGLFMVIALIFGIFTRKPTFEFSIIFTYGFVLVILFTGGLLLLAGVMAAIGGLIGVKIKMLKESIES